MIRCVVLRFMICCIAMVLYAEAEADVVVHQGVNEIPLSIENKTLQSIQTLHVSINPTQLPDWVTFEQAEVVTQIDGDQIRIQLPVSVDNPSQGAFVEIPLVLADNEGRQWQVPIGLRFENRMPMETALKQNMPNPFNPETSIEYHLAGTKTQQVSLIVYSALGQNIRTLVNAQQIGGVYKVRWDGKDDLGRAVASGIYITKLIYGDFNQTKNMIFLK